MMYDEKPPSRLYYTTVCKNCLGFVDKFYKFYFWRIWYCSGCGSTKKPDLMMIAVTEDNVKNAIEKKLAVICE